jgi:hypothetical protein
VGGRTSGHSRRPTSGTDHPQAFFLCLFGVTLAYLLYRLPTPEFFLRSQDYSGQMAVALAMLAGRIPSVDSLTGYGPLVAASSAIGLWVSDKAVLPILTGEIIVCAAGYALTIALLGSFVSRWTRRWLGTVCAIALLLLFPRYYKWYYWLWPALVLLMFEFHLASSRAGQARLSLVLWGAVSGIGALYRYDLGLVSGCFALGTLAVSQWARERRGIPWAALKNWTWFLAGLLLPPLLWVIGWSIARGSVAWLPASAGAAVTWSHDVATAYSIPPFQFSAQSPRQNILPTIQVLLPLCYLAGFGWGASRARGSYGAPVDLLFTAVALMGLGLLPQAYHRAEAQHLLQTIWPAPVLAALAMARGAPGRWRAVLAFPLVLSIVALAPNGGMDLAPFARNWKADWIRLSGLPDSMPSHPTADTAMALRRLTKPEDPIFIAARWTVAPILVFSQRHIVGTQPFYTPHILTGPRWAARDREALSAHPPAFLVAPADWLTADPNSLAPYLPDIIEGWRRSHSVVVHDNGTWRILRSSP